MPDTVVELTHPLTTHEGSVTRIVLREPRAKDLFEIGEPIEWSPADANGIRYAIELPNQIGEYVRRCVVKVDPAFLEQIGLADGMKLRDAVLGFFGAARRAAYPEPAISSSSTLESSQPASAAS